MRKVIVFALEILDIPEKDSSSFNLPDNRIWYHRNGPKINDLDTIFNLLPPYKQIHYIKPSEEIFEEIWKIWSKLFNKDKTIVFDKFKKEIIENQIEITEGYVNLLFNTLYLAAEFGFSSLTYLFRKEVQGSVFSPGSLLGLQVYLSKLIIKNENYKAAYFNLISKIQSDEIEDLIIGEDYQNREIIDEYFSFPNKNYLEDGYLKKILILIYKISNLEEAQSLNMKFSFMVYHLNELINLSLNNLNKKNFDLYDRTLLLIALIRKIYGISGSVSDEDSSTVVWNSWIDIENGTTNLKPSLSNLKYMRFPPTLQNFKPDINFVHEMSEIGDRLEKVSNGIYRSSNKGASDHMKIFSELNINHYREIERFVFELYGCCENVAQTLNNYYVKTNSKSLNEWIDQTINTAERSDKKIKHISRIFVNYLNTTYIYDLINGTHEDFKGKLIESLISHPEIFNDESKLNAYISLLFRTFNQSAEFGFNSIQQLHNLLYIKDYNPFEPKNLILLSIYLSKILREEIDVKEFSIYVIGEIVKESDQPQFTSIARESAKNRVFYNQFKNLYNFVENLIYNKLLSINAKFKDTNHGLREDLTEFGAVDSEKLIQRLIENFDLIFESVCKDSLRYKTFNFERMSQDVQSSTYSVELKNFIAKLISNLMGFDTYSDEYSSIIEEMSRSSISPIQGSIRYLEFISGSLLDNSFTYSRINKKQTDNLSVNVEQVDFMNSIGPDLLGKLYNNTSSRIMLTHSISNWSILCKLRQVDPEGIQSQKAFGANISILFEDEGNGEL